MKAKYNKNLLGRLIISVVQQHNTGKLQFRYRETVLSCSEKEIRFYSMIFFSSLISSIFTDELTREAPGLFFHGCLPSILVSKFMFIHWGVQRKYVSCSFFLEPPSPYNSFHCFSSPIMEPSAAKLAAT
jgi:hypothetical protein